MPVTASDDFNRADSTSLGADWTQNRGNHDIAANRMKTATNQSGVSHAAFTGVAPTSADMYVKAIKRGGGSDNHTLGVGARQKSAAFGSFDAYIAELDLGADVVRLSRTVAGSATELATASVTLVNDVDYTLEIRVSGTGATVSITVLRNDSQVITYDDSATSRITATNYAGVYDTVNAASATKRVETDDFEFGTLAAPLDRDLTARWQTQATLTTDLTARWQTQATLDRDLTARWQVLTSAGGDLALLWRTLARLDRDLAARWNVSGPLTADLALRWQTLATLTTDRALRWQALVILDRDLAARWNVNQDSTILIADLTIRWQALAAVTRDLAATWQTLAPLDRDLTARWQTLALVTLDQALRWQTLAALSTDQALRWQVLALLDRDLGARWRVLAEQERDLALVWQVGSLFGAGGSLPYGRWGERAPAGAWQGVRRP